MSKIIVDIGEVVLEGLETGPRNSRSFGRMTETAVKRLLEERGVPFGLKGGYLRVLALPDIHLPVNVSDERIARELAEAVYRAIGTVG